MRQGSGSAVGGVRLCVLAAVIGCAVTPACASSPDPQQDRLVPVSTAIPKTCTAAADALGGPVPCPTKIRKSVVGHSACADTSTCVVVPSSEAGPVFGLDFVDDHAESEIPYHVTWNAYQLEHAPPSVCLDPEPLDTGTVRFGASVVMCSDRAPRTASEATSGYGVFSSHLLAFWESGGDRLLVSTHQDRRNVDPALLMELLDHTVVVRPRHNPPG